MNDQRPRTGKLSHMKSPEYMIQLLLKSHINLMKHKFNIKIVPVCINQDRIVDANFLVTEMQSGQFKPGTTLVNMMQHVVSQEKGCLGNVFVKYESPLDLSSYVSSPDPPDFESIAMKLTQDLYLTQQKNSPITMNAMITSSLLYQTSSELTFGSIKKTSQRLYEHILAKGYKTYCSASPENYDVNLAVKHLGYQVVGKALDKHKGNEAKVILKQDHNVLALAYYSS
jgi:glycerol-3-phosphate O-acyltransferase